MNHLELNLLKKYKTILSNEGYPDWSFKVYPAMPFIGNDYQKSKPKILLYGSTENLSEYFGKKENWITSLGEYGFTRNRYMFDKEANKKDFFPYNAFHMQPIQDGSLLTVAKFIVEKTIPNNKFSDDPYTFLEQLTVGNIAKFSIKSKSNIDYPTSSKIKLMCSFPYIVEEIQLLRPDIIIIPITIYRKVIKELNNLFVKIKLKPKVIEIYQVNSQAIYPTIGPYLRNRNLNYEHIVLSPVIVNWTNNVRILNSTGSKKRKDSAKLMRMYLTWLNNSN